MARANTAQDAVGVERRAYTAREVAAAIGLPYETTLQIIRRDMAYRRAGRHYLVTATELERYLSGEPAKEVRRKTSR
jgi:excisionase family DNA binding protein